MTDQQIRDLGPAFSHYLRPFRGFCNHARTAKHLDSYCRALLTAAPRKTVEPDALVAGTAVRTLQKFLTTTRWDHLGVRNEHQHRVQVQLVTRSCPDSLGTVGVLDETSCVTKGDQTPGVQRQYLGCVGQVDHGIVTVHLAVTRGRLSYVARCRFVSAEQLGRGSQTVRKVRDSQGDRVSAEMDDRVGSVLACIEEWPGVRLVDVRRRVWQQAVVHVDSGDLEAEVRGGDSEEFCGGWSRWTIVLSGGGVASVAGETCQEVSVEAGDATRPGVASGGSEGVDEWLVDDGGGGLE